MADLNDYSAGSREHKWFAAISSYCEGKNYVAICDALLAAGLSAYTSEDERVCGWLLRCMGFGVPRQYDVGRGRKERVLARVGWSPTRAEMNAKYWATMARKKAAKDGG